MGRVREGVGRVRKCERVRGKLTSGYLKES